MCTTCWKAKPQTRKLESNFHQEWWWRSGRASQRWYSWYIPSSHTWRDGSSGQLFLPNEGETKSCRRFLLCRKSHPTFENLDSSQPDRDDRTDTRGAVSWEPAFVTRRTSKNTTTSRRGATATATTIRTQTKVNEILTFERSVSVVHQGGSGRHCGLLIAFSIGCLLQRSGFLAARFVVCAKFRVQLRCETK